MTIKLFIQKKLYQIKRTRIMKKIAQICILGITAITIATLSSCSGNAKKVKDDDSIVSEIKKEQVEKEVEEFVYPLPTAFEVTNMLNRIGASYILTLSNPIESADKYFTEKSKALNLGIYNADLSYASAYNQKQNVIDYMNASNKLIEQLGFGDVIDEETLKEIEAVEDDKDKVVDLISETFYETYEYLNKTDRGSLSILVLAGSWTEALYIATHISEETYNNVEMVKLVMEQKEPLNKLMEIMKDYESNADVAETIEALEKVQSIFNTLENGSISKEQMEAITAEIYKIRTAMVS